MVDRQAGGAGMRNGIAADNAQNRAADHRRTAKIAPLQRNRILRRRHIGLVNAGVAHRPTGVISISPVVKMGEHIERGAVAVPVHVIYSAFCSRSGVKPKPEGGRVGVEQPDAMADRFHPAINCVSWLPPVTPSNPRIALFRADLAGRRGKGLDRVLVVRKMVIFGHIARMFPAVAVDLATFIDRRHAGPRPVGVNPL